MDISPLGLMVEKALWMRCFTVQYRQQPISRTMPGLQQSKGGSADFQTVKLLLNQFCLTMLQAVLHKKILPEGMGNGVARHAQILHERDRRDRSDKGTKGQNIVKSNKISILD